MTEVTEPFDLLARLRAECEYDPDPEPDDPDSEIKGSVDSLIAYKDVLEELVMEMLGTVSMSWSGDAAENFAEQIHRIGQMGDWYVRLTTQAGEHIEAVIVGSGVDVKIDGDTWWDAVTYLPADEAGIAVEGAEPRTVRVSNVHVY